MSFQLPDWLRYDIQKKLERLQSWWKDLALRRWANDNPKLVLAMASASVLLLLVSVIWLAWPEEPPPVVEYEKEWFYDLNTGVLFSAEKDQTPPIEAPSGPLPDGTPAGVRAYVLAYVNEPNEAERFIAFLETTDPRTRNDTPDTTGRPVSGAKQWGRGKLLRRLKDKRWVPANSFYGQAILKESFTPNENGETPYYYPPK